MLTLVRTKLTKTRGTSMGNLHDAAAEEVFHAVTLNPNSYKPYNPKYEWDCLM